MDPGIAIGTGGAITPVLWWFQTKPIPIDVVSLSPKQIRRRESFKRFCQRDLRIRCTAGITAIWSLNDPADALLVFRD
jgi:hypothetical protein